MKTFILIGGIGAGKSTVSALMEAKGARCVNTDLLGHEALSDVRVVEELVDAFGEGVLDDAGAVSRKALAQLAFASPEAAKRLSAITHPVILTHLSQVLGGLARFRCKVAVVEASAFDGPDGAGAALADRADGIIAVVCDEETRIGRAVAAGYDEADVRARIANQPSDDQRIAWADYVIRNDGSRESLEEQVNALWERIEG